MQLAQILIGLPAMVWGKAPAKSKLEEFKLGWGRKEKIVVDPNQPADWPRPATKEQVERFNKHRLLAQVEHASGKRLPAIVKGLPPELQPRPTAQQP